MCARLSTLGSKSNNPEYADIPTLEELGYKGYCTDTYSGFYFSKDVAPEIVETFDAAVKKVFRGSGGNCRSEKKQSLTLSYADSETFAAEISQSKEAIIPVLEELGFKK